MKLTHMTVAAVCVAMTLVACQKDQLSGNQTSKQLKAGPPADEQGEDIMAQFFKQQRDQATEHHKIRADKGGVIITAEGTEVHVDPNVLRDANGEQISGWVNVAIQDNYSRGADALANRPTEAAQNPDQDDPGLITSAGSFEFDFTTENGGDVTNPGGGVEVRVPAENMGAVQNGQADPDMKIWVGEESADQDRDNTWEENGEVPVIVGDEYRFELDVTLERVNLDRRLNWAGPFIPLTVDLPSNFNELNAEVYVTFDGFPGAISTMDVYDMTNAWWGEHLGWVNPGVNIHIIGVGVYGGVLYSEIKAVTTNINTPGGGDHEVLTNMTATNPTALAAAINGLP